MNDKVFILHARPLVPTPKTGDLRHRSWSATRGATFAVKRGKFGLFYVAMALCSRKDNYCRKIGRQIAEQRLHKQKVWHCRKGLSSVLRDIREVCYTHKFILPVSSVTYLEETFNGKSKAGR